MKVKLVSFLYFIMIFEYSLANAETCAEQDAMELDKKYYVSAAYENTLPNEEILKIYKTIFSKQIIDLLTQAISIEKKYVHLLQTKSKDDWWLDNSVMFISFPDQAKISKASYDKKTGVIATRLSPLDDNGVMDLKSGWDELTYVSIENDHCVITNVKFIVQSLTLIESINSYIAKMQKEIPILENQNDK